MATEVIRWQASDGSLHMSKEVADNRDHLILFVEDLLRILDNVADVSDCVKFARDVDQLDVIVALEKSGWKVSE